MAASQDAYIVTVCRNFSWASPAEIDKMFFDAKDHHGLIYWYNDVAKQHAQIEAANKPKPK